MIHFLTITLLVFLTACSQTKQEITDRNNLKEADDISYNVLDYSKLEELDIRLPYIYEYSKNNKSILVYGSYHTSDPKDSIIEDIESNINKFKPDVILYEGDGISVEETKEKSIQYYFEMGLVRFLSHKREIMDINLEPSIRKKYRDILGRHPQNEVFLATIGLQITLLLTSEKNVDFEQFYIQFISTLRKEGYPITNNMTDINYFYKIYEAFYGTPFDLNTFDYETVEIKFNKTKLNQINQESAHFRDLHMLRMIDSLFTDYHRIYVQIGGRHAIVWEPAIKEIIEKENKPVNKTY